MQADSYGNILDVTNEQQQAIRMERIARSQRREYREYGLALASIAHVMMDKGCSAMEATANANDKQRTNYLMSVNGADLDENQVNAILMIQPEVALQEFPKLPQLTETLE